MGDAEYEALVPAPDGTIFIYSKAEQKLRPFPLKIAEIVAQAPLCLPSGDGRELAMVAEKTTSFFEVSASTGALRAVLSSEWPPLWRHT